MMIRAVVVDDEALARRHLARLLETHPDVQIAGDASNGVEALQLIADEAPDVAFLDVEMPGLNAFDLLAELARPPLVVFATAFDHYAISAFDANAIDYLLKPIQPARLAHAVDRIRATLGQPREEYASLLRRALATLKTNPPAKLAARRGRRIVLLSPREILYACVEDQIVFLHTQAERFATDRTIAELDELLAPAGFVRISRAAIINLHYARELLPWSSGTWKVKLSNNVELDVSRDRGRELKAMIG